jgi:hypothetical protein
MKRAAPSRNTDSCKCLLLLLQLALLTEFDYCLTRGLERNEHCPRQWGDCLKRFRFDLLLRPASLADFDYGVSQELEQSEHRLRQKGVHLKHTRADMHLGGGSGSGSASCRDTTEAG